MAKMSECLKEYSLSKISCNVTTVISYCHFETCCLDVWEGAKGLPGHSSARFHKARGIEVQGWNAFTPIKLVNVKCVP